MPYNVELVVKFPIDWKWKQQALIFEHFLQYEHEHILCQHLGALGI